MLTQDSELCLALLRLTVWLAYASQLTTEAWFLCLLSRDNNARGLCLSPQECHEGTKCVRICREDICL